MNEMGLELEDRHMLTSNVAGVESGVNKGTLFHYHVCVFQLYLNVAHSALQQHIEHII